MMDAYTVLAGSYDRLTRDVDYERWADYAQRHFAKQKCPVETVLELGCGKASPGCWPGGDTPSPPWTCPPICWRWRSRSAGG